MPTPIAAMAATISANTSAELVTASTSRASRLSKNQRFQWFRATVAPVDKIRQVGQPQCQHPGALRRLPRQYPPAKRPKAPTTRGSSLKPGASGA